MPPIRLRNLTPHTVTFWLSDGRKVDLVAELPTPRCTIVRIPDIPVISQVGEIPVSTARLDGRIVDLPDVQPDTWLIVPRAIVAAAPDRLDLVFPDDIIRDPATGQVIGCRALGRG